MKTPKELRARCIEITKANKQRYFNNSLCVRCKGAGRVAVNNATTGYVLTVQICKLCYSWNSNKEASDKFWEEFKEMNTKSTLERGIFYE